LGLAPKKIFSFVTGWVIGCLVQKGPFSGLLRLFFGCSALLQPAKASFDWQQLPLFCLRRDHPNQLPIFYLNKKK
jgi:hypothetical protein